MGLGFIVAFYMGSSILSISNINRESAKEGSDERKGKSKGSGEREA